jgi:3-hydroxyacyl-[acyl-carrier-protein] dehydratase
MFPAVTDLIPHRPPFLFVDAIVAAAPDGLVARRTWRPEEAFYQGHYPGAPITPGVLLCEAVFQTGCVFLALERPAGDPTPVVPMIAKIGDVRFRQPVYPGETTELEVKRKDTLAGFTLLHGIVRIGEKRVMTVDFAVTWRPPAAPTAP